MRFFHFLGQFVIHNLELIAFLSAQNALVRWIVGVRLEELVRHVEYLVLLDKVAAQDRVPYSVLLVQVEAVLQVVVVVCLYAHESKNAILLLKSESVVVQVYCCDGVALICQCAVQEGEDSLPQVHTRDVQVE